MREFVEDFYSDQPKIKIKQSGNGWIVTQDYVPKGCTFWRTRTLKRFDEKADAERYAQSTAFDRAEQSAGR